MKVLIGGRGSSLYLNIFRSKFRYGLSEKRHYSYNTVTGCLTTRRHRVFTYGNLLPDGRSRVKFTLYGNIGRTNFACTAPSVSCDGLGEALLVNNFRKFGLFPASGGRSIPHSCACCWRVCCWRMCRRLSAHRSSNGRVATFLLGRTLRLNVILGLLFTLNIRRIIRIRLLDNTTFR